MVSNKINFENANSKSHIEKIVTEKNPKNFCYAIGACPWLNRQLSKQNILILLKFTSKGAVNWYQLEALVLISATKL